MRLNLLPAISVGMKFSVFGREVDLRMVHLLLVISVFLAYGLAILVLGVAGGVIGESDAAASITNISNRVIGIIVPLDLPLIAFIFLSVLPAFKLQKDVNSCRSVAVAFWLLVFALSVAGFAYLVYLVQGLPLAYVLIVIIEYALSIAVNLAVVYLWMLIFLKMDWGQVKAAAFPATLAALAIVASGIALEYGIFEWFGVGSIPKTGLALIPKTVEELFFALPLIYFLPKKLDTASYAFAGAYVGIALLSIAGTLVLGYDADILNTIVKAVLAIGIIYLFGRYGDRIWGMEQETGARRSPKGSIK
jgi:hypothetical protein